MSVVRGLAAGAAGAAAYSAYRDADLTGGGKGLAAGLFEAFQRKGAAQMAEVSGGGRSKAGRGMYDCAESVCLCGP